MHQFGECEWTPKIPFHHLIFVPKYEWVSVYKNSHSWEVKRLARKDEVLVAKCAPVLVDGCRMMPIEGGGSVPASNVRVATAADLGLNQSARNTTKSRGLRPRSVPAEQQ